MLALAGAFQFTPLKDACLDKCRHPAQFLIRFYERGAGGGFRFGARHGAFCVGCCWALMLVMFAAGVASLVWMALLTALMVHEKTRPAGARAVPVTGVALLAAASVVLPVRRGRLSGLRTSVRWGVSGLGPSKARFAGEHLGSTVAERLALPKTTIYSWVSDISADRARERQTSPRTGPCAASTESCARRPSFGGGGSSCS